MMKDSEQAVFPARDFAEAVIRTARDPFLILDAGLHVERANEAFYTTFKVSPEESVGRTVFQLDQGRWDIPKLRELLQDILPRHSFFNNFELTHNFANIGHRTMLLNARTLSATSGQGIQSVGSRFARSGFPERKARAGRLSRLRSRLMPVLDCRNKRYRRQVIWAAGAARAKSIPAAGCDERATKPDAQIANEYRVYFCNQALVPFTLSGLSRRTEERHACDGLKKNWNSA